MSVTVHRPRDPSWRTPGQAIREGGEAGLASAVIEQAWHDIGMIVGPRGLANRVSALERAEAVAFLTATEGPWARARADWCGAAGMDAETLRQRALRRLGHAA